MTIVKSGRGKDQWLKTELRDGKVVVSIGVDVLAFAAQRHYDERFMQESEDGSVEAADFRIVREADFAKSVLRALEREEEDGTTLVHRMFDGAFDWLLDYDVIDGIEDAETETPTQNSKETKP